LGIWAGSAEDEGEGGGDEDEDGEEDGVGDPLETLKFTWMK
jgi:hypothetical protein